MKKILIVNPSQFGYETNIFYVCKYLAPKLNITYLCWDFKKERLILEGVNVLYISRNGNIISRNLSFLKVISNVLKNNDYDIVFIKYFKIMSSIVKFLHPNYKFIIDIRSGSVQKSTLSRYIKNIMMILVLKNFEHKTVISSGLARKLKVDNNAYILPLGAETISQKTKNFNKMNLFYIGTLINRNIEETVTGFARFYREYNNLINMKYTIVGGGNKADEQLIKNIIIKEKMENSIYFVGPIPHNIVKPYFELCNIGVSYIPMTEYFDVQPPTKTFEYLLSGMPVIATKTSENIKIINENNGILIEDTPYSFYHGLVKLYNSLKKYNSKNIIENSECYSWSHITKDFNTYLMKII